MVYKVLLSDRALNDLRQTVAYLLQEWTIKEADSFLNELERVKKLLIIGSIYFPGI
ncbi:MAG: type II toxin-antitoxin system RelE/ParE family toxin [Flavobacteriaceae bacterium]|nr:type II toxin-antitoxin system RelE/ParE family toxin [Flavobacteriaceae bacterium]